MRAGPGRLAGAAWRAGLPAAVALAALIAWPLASVLWRGVAPDGAPSWEAILAVAGDRFYWERLGFTTAQALASTALALAVGLPGAALFALVRFPGRRLALALVTVPFVLPTLVVAVAFLQLAGPGGWVSDLLALAGLPRLEPRGTLWAILAAHAFFNLAIVIRLVSGVWANLDPAPEEAARLLGAGPVAVVRHVTLPVLGPAVAAAAALVFLFTFTSFGVVLVLGGPGLDTLEVTIFRLAVRLVALPEAAILSLVQIGATLGALGTYAWLQRRIAAHQVQRPDRARPLSALSWRARSLAAAEGLLLALFLGAPLAALAWGALTVDLGRPSLAHFARLFEETSRVSFIAPADAVRWSLSFAAAATVIAVALGVTAATAVARTPGRRGVLLDALLMLPLAVPAVVLGFGYLTTFDRGWYDLRGSAWLVLFAHTLVAYPFVLRATLAVRRSLDPRLREAARLLGAGPVLAWRHVELPLMARGVLAGSVFAFAVSLGEFGATSVLRRQEFATLPIAIFDALGRPAGLGRALALCTILMLVTAASALLISRLRYREIGEF